VRELEPDAALPHRNGGGLALPEPGKVAQVPLGRWAGNMASQSLGVVYLQNVTEIPQCGVSVALNVIDAPAKVVVAFAVTTARSENRQVANGVPEAGRGRARGAGLSSGTK